MEPVMTQPTDGESWKMCDTDEGSISLSYIAPVRANWTPDTELKPAAKLTGTFFWDRITAQSLPRTPIAMMLAAVMALNAYSDTSPNGQLLPGPIASLQLAARRRRLAES